MEFLRRIVAHKQQEVALRQRTRPLDQLKKVPARRPRDFAAALRKPGIGAIAEIKRHSPSKGPLCEELDPADLARSYARRGAVALSVLTDREFFGGSEDDLRLAREAVDLPVLRKDFTIDEYQIHEARQIGADAILLIVRILSDAQLRQYLQTARELGLAVLTEIHDEAELARALDCGAQIAGANSRNLDTFEVSLSTALRLKESIPAECTAVAESGIHTRDDVKRLAAAGYDAILVGETLMRAPDPGAKLGELLGGAS
ncbi:MAG: indole-3-glycerol phosphate synthase TrpC [Phycisphaerae bacterium]